MSAFAKLLRRLEGSKAVSKNGIEMLQKFMKTLVFGIKDEDQHNLIDGELKRVCYKITDFVSDM